MHSSPDLDAAAADDEMFPEGPSTPRNAASRVLGTVDELSPPNSQGPSQATTTNPILNANGKRVLTTAGEASSSSTDTVHTDKATGYQWKRPEDRPGYEWTNPRAREDHERAWESIVDKASQIKTKYGDPLKPEVLVR
ncbi:hypothetical protein P280DRAFT_456849 [Massarina eburnea CBS 473.64]|uniref:Uncharacterized protein n=1 Tax=Massarina eburnea CBS 473.64 TaxID=1395130 RepID=A0A6A6RS56_9PLEO|nr:hypothetical protein P280DRAFT_456849 [Massarina eburnea CBS 473.64]